MGFLNKVTILLISLLILPHLSSKAQGDDDQSLIDKGKVKVKLNKAQDRFLENDMRGTLNLCREVLAIHDGNAKANFLLARAQYELGHYELAEKYVKRAGPGKERIGEEFYLVRGRVHHRLEELDSAIARYEKYKEELEGKTLPKDRQIDASDVEHFIEQCKFAKKAMKDPVDIERTNLGSRINSRYDEYNPCVTDSGEKIIFTGRRPDTKGGAVDQKGDHQYFEDIYYSEWNEEKGEWSRPEGIPGRINTETYDAILSLAPEGDVMYIYRNTKKDAGNILRAEKSSVSGDWRSPEQMPKPIKSSFYEGSISATKGEDKVYFISERKGGEGRGDIYVSEKKGRDKWSEPRNLGNKVNTPRDEKYVHITPDGNTLFFASNGHQGLGSYDIFKCEKTDDGWTEPENLGYPINTVNEESTFSFDKDYETMYMAGKFEENHGSRDLYKVDLKDLDLH